MTPGSPNAAMFRVTDENGDPVTGLDIADFNTFGRYLEGSGALPTWPHAATVLPDPDLPGWYIFTFTGAPATPLWRFAVTAVDPVHHKVYPDLYTDQQINTDTDYLLGALSRTVVLDTISILIGSELPRTKGAYFYDEWNIPITLGGLPLDLSDYTDLTLRVNTLDKTTRSLEVRNGESGFVLTASAEGILHIEWPDDTGTGVTDIYAHLPAGATSATPLKWQVDGLLNGDPTKRVPIIRSSDLTLFRSEEVVQ